MINIDFLPKEYRQQKSDRRQRIWRLGVLAAFGCVLAGTFLFQLLSRQRVADRIEGVEKQYQTAQALTARLAKLQIELANYREQAKLATFLDHPWPTTQLLARVVRDIPPSITFKQLTLESEKAKTATSPRRRRPPPPTTETATGPAASHDLKELAGRFDQSQVTVVLDGTAANIAELHAYVAKLNQDRLFASADLASLTEQEFVLKVVVRAGYGQSRGPTGLPKSGTSKSLARSPASHTPTINSPQ